MAETTFWMVYLEGGNAPREQHPLKADAYAEAGRLAKKHNCRVWVLEAVAVCQLGELYWTELPEQVKQG